jgi:hypothetical protein
MLGLPESGKSTYLGALYYLLRKGRDERLVLGAEPPEREYLQELEDRWLRYRPFERSQHPGARRVELELHGSETNDLALSMPDVTGEGYDHLWEDGLWSDQVRELARTADGMLLFIHPDKLKVPELINVNEQPPAGGAEPVEWKPQMSPTQAVLCDLLEQINAQRPASVASLAIVVSAWDRAADLGIDPWRWVELQVPLLWQWLCAQEPPFEFRVFGISAEGGDVSDPAIKEQLAEREDPLARILEGPGADGLLDPLLWLLSA